MARGTVPTGMPTGVKDLDCALAILEKHIPVYTGRTQNQRITRKCPPSCTRMNTFLSQH